MKEPEEHGHIKAIKGNRFVRFSETLTPTLRHRLLRTHIVSLEASTIASILPSPSLD